MTVTIGRRELLAALGGAAAAWPLAARAQQAGRVWRVAVIGAVSPLPAMLSAFREALQQRGWTEGKNLSIDVRWPKVSFAQEPGLISEVLHSNVDVIVAWSTPSALAARRATSTIPIVFLGVSRSGLDSRRVFHTLAATPRAAATSRPMLALSWWERLRSWFPA
jgi:putative ABC transport system substrate-binding protein